MTLFSADVVISIMRLPLLSTGEEFQIAILPWKNCPCDKQQIYHSRSIGLWSCKKHFRIEQRDATEDDEMHLRSNYLNRLVVSRWSRRVIDAMAVTAVSGSWSSVPIFT